jgi:hypothetical protein
LAVGLLAAVALMTAPGTALALAGRLRWPLAFGVGPALTYGVIGLAIVPFGAIGIPWNAVTAMLALLVTIILIVVIRALAVQFGKLSNTATEGVRTGPALLAASGVVFGALAIGYAAWRGMPHWQSIPSTWDSVWHANTVRWILETGQASPTHMGELRNVETHAELYYPSAFHALAAVFAQLTGAAPTTAYTLNALAASIWLFPLSATLLTWQLLRPKTGAWRTAGAAAAAGALSASFTALPYVEFDTASVPNLVAYGIAVPAFVLVSTALRHRDRIPLAVVALVGVFTVHITGGVVVVTLVLVWWLLDALWHPVVSRAKDFATLAVIAVPSLAVLLPQFLGVLAQADIIVGHEFVTHLGRKRTLFNALVQHTRHLNDFPIQNLLIGLAGIGIALLLIKRIWWPVATWALLIVAIVHSGAPFGGPLGSAIGAYSDLFYSDPRRLSAMVTMLLAPMAGIALYAMAVLLVTGTRALVRRLTGRAADGPGWVVATAVLLTGVCVALTWHYFPRHRYLMGEKYDQVMVNAKTLEAMAYLATLPDAHDTLIGNANVDGTAWMYAVADLHPLWTHYDYPMQQGPGYQRFIFWAYADDADHDPRIAEAVKALNIRYVLTNSTVVRGFVMPDGLVSLDKSKSWAKIYDNGRARIYEWRGSPLGASQ